ncbi:hypothetical protein [Geomonas anaerohicana]|uniref:DUF2249 domain-containing protein n=1 Tax=Geomonas anaerohicana TaxID=2798583 RepID=A0ABS0YIT4_9BACT|nr:hypothetical protein [Geomonas anaerohicana]MBJ6752248.1 hypothetical protein [Geomonas anaerohicana]
MKRTLRTLELIWRTVLPPRGGAPQPTQPGEVRPCEPEDIGRGMGLYLDSKGEVRLFVPQCRPLAASVVLFRLKRQGFSRCSVEESEGGLLIRAQR